MADEFEYLQAYMVCVNCDPILECEGEQKRILKVARHHAESLGHRVGVYQESLATFDGRKAESDKP